MDPKGMIGMIYKEDYYALLHTKYKSSRAHGFREFFYVLFSIVRIWRLMTLGQGHY